jgi:hypothetical protein
MARAAAWHWYMMEGCILHLEVQVSEEQIIVAIANAVENILASDIAAIIAGLP